MGHFGFSFERYWRLLIMDLWTYKRTFLATLGIVLTTALLPILMGGWGEEDAFIVSFALGMVTWPLSSMVGYWYVNARVFHAKPIPYPLIPVTTLERLAVLETISLFFLLIAPAVYGVLGCAIAMTEEGGMLFGQLSQAVTFLWSELWVELGAQAGEVVCLFVVFLLLLMLVSHLVYTCTMLWQRRFLLGIVIAYILSNVVLQIPIQILLSVVTFETVALPDGLTMLGAGYWMIAYEVLLIGIGIWFMWRRLRTVPA